MRPYLTIRDGKLVCEIGDDSTVVTSLAQLVTLAPDGCLCSSSIDFPEDCTTDPVVLEVCRQLR